MKKLFTNPELYDRVVLTIDGIESNRRIVDVTKKAIRVSSCNLYKFNRDGTLNKSDSSQGRINASIRPIRGNNA